MSKVTLTSSNAGTNYTSREGLVERFSRKDGRVVMCTDEPARACYELPVGAMIGLTARIAPRKGDKVRLTFSGERPVAARIKR